MPRNRKKKSKTPQSSAYSQGLFTVPPLAVDCSDSRCMAVYPSIYHGGCVDCLSPFEPKVTFTSIVCQTEYSHLSPEELRFQDLEIDTDPARWDPHSFEEARLRYYLDEGLTSVPQFGPSIPASAFSVSSRVKSMSSDAVPDSGSSCFGLGCPASGPTVDGESTTSLCSLCAAKLDADVQGCEEYGATSKRLGRDKSMPNLSGHCDILGRKKRSRISRRVRRLEKTVESLSHGLILALTELRDFRAHSTKTDDSDVVDTQTTAFSSLSAVGDHPDSTFRASAPGSNLHPSEQPDPTPQRKSTTPRTNANLTAPSISGESKFGPTAKPNSVVGHITTRNDSSPFVSNNWSPISELLRPILDFMTSTQLFDLLWVSDNLFNVHGGILIYCLQKSLIPMGAISGVPGLSDWSQDRELMRKPDETYRKYLRPSIDTDGSCNSVTKIAWYLYCIELGGIFSEQFPDWESAISFFQNLAEGYNGCLSPMITSSYIEDLSGLWAQVHPALLEVTRWLEPFIDYGPDYDRATPLYDATIALGRHARELLSRRGGVRASQGASIVWDKNLMQLLRDHRSGELLKMQCEMESVMSRAVSRNFDPAAAATEETPSAEVAALIDRARQVTFWRTTEPLSAQMQDALALGEVCVMRSYRPRLLRAGTAAARIRSDMFGVLVQTGLRTDMEGGPIDEREVFWDGVDLPSSP
ncbi:hypothetical protein BJY52DRAFT_1275024 [Lactarius psammicola]|nr:hypothetical protein BJY52DRAFT_1275024 [Lactarius psammicola]